MLFPTPADLKARPARERILLTAHELFYREGIRATGIDRVIAESGVAKLTFYRHFPSKQALMLAYLELRHRIWLDWFQAALARHARPGRAAADILTDALAEWLGEAGYRGCAFINGMVELGGTEPEVRRLAQAHKQAMSAAIAAVLPAGPRQQARADALAMAVDGAIVRAQLDGDAAAALGTLRHLAEAALQAAV